MKRETIHPSPITLPAPSPYYILCLSSLSLSLFFFLFRSDCISRPQRDLGRTKLLWNQSQLGGGGAGEPGPGTAEGSDEQSPGVNYSAQVLLLLQTSNRTQLPQLPPGWFSPSSPPSIFAPVLLVISGSCSCAEFKARGIIFLW